MEVKKRQIALLERLEQDGRIDLFYLDESGFCLTPCVPYGWQQKGQTVKIPCAKDKRLNVLGLYNRDNVFYPFQTEQIIDSKFVVGALDEFVQYIARPTVVVVDNAPTHTSKLFMDKIEEWMGKNLYIFYLPKYSPELNRIEILWRFIKYEWIKVEAYTSWGNLLKNLREIFEQIGEKYQIKFT